MLLYLLRGIFIAVIILVATYASAIINRFVSFQLSLVAFGMVCLVGIVALGLDLLIRNKQIMTISVLSFGLLIGLVMGALFSMALEPFLSDYKELAQPVRLLITVVCCYLCVSTLFQTRDDFRFIIPYVGFSKQIKSGTRPLVLDASAIIEGRIADVCDTQIIDGKLIVPRFVLQQLQHIATSSDKVRRIRGRRGLEMLKKMQTNGKIELQVHDANLAELSGVEEADERLVIFAKALGARVVTNDFNLNKVAQLQGVDVINLNELANALKLVALPGEILSVRVVKPGDQTGQGVGYLDDGTMVVVEQGRSLIGQEVAITVASVLQTNAGRMIFGRIESQPETRSKSSTAPAEKPWCFAAKTGQEEIGIRF
jgi:uncharacterized protein YacL